MNVLIDSYGWIEYFSDGSLADKYAGYIEKANVDEYVTPSIVLYEVYKKIKREDSEDNALEAYAYIVHYTRIIPIDEVISLAAADKSLEYDLGMADSRIMATADNNNARIVTGDKHLRKFNNVVYIE